MMTVLLKRLFLISQVAAFSVLAKDQSFLRKGGSIINQDKLDAVGEYDAFVSRQLRMSHSMPICILPGETCAPSFSVGPKETCSTCCSGNFTCPPNVIGGLCTCDTSCLPATAPCFGGSVPPGNDSCSKCCSKNSTCIPNLPGGACACIPPPNCLPVDTKCTFKGGFKHTSCLNCCSGVVCQTTPDNEGGSPFCC